LISPTYAATIAGAKQSGDYFFGISPLMLSIRWVAKLKSRDLYQKQWTAVLEKSF